ncbi:MAG: hypothetical protein KatS3mg032_0979 [Cyclobacteriaceae bacterium]|nr:MAG: hypothetical protein KatS3mg032_0979 [Cyclobacteriaceae bacterium]
MRAVRIILLIITPTLWWGAVLAGNAPERKFDAKKLEQLRADPSLHYQPVSSGISWWDRLRLWASDWLNEILYTATTTDWTSILILGLFIIGLIYVVLRLLHIDTLNVFYRNQPAAVAIAHTENIHTIDLNILLQEALKQQNYRLAIRLRFLQALKILADKGLINWQAGKTTHEYLAELPAASLREGLQSINYYYEYTWYGNFSASPELYRRVNAIYGNIADNLP